jgi:uncharacterized flavoprotein (TIGR03862 family)
MKILFLTDNFPPEVNAPASRTFEHCREWVRAGHRVTVFERMPSPGRKLLMAGRGGLNLTHAEALEVFLPRYRPQAPMLLDAVRAYPPAALIAWCEGLGIETFVGSSGRVFPKTLKASPLLRAWMGRLAGLGVELRTRHRWIGLDGTTPRFATPEGEVAFAADAVVLALGGASWPRLGSDGAWTALLPGVPVRPFQPSNVGFALDWSAKMQAHAGTPLKRIALSFEGRTMRGEAMLTATLAHLWDVDAPERSAKALQDDECATSVEVGVPGAERA